MKILKICCAAVGAGSLLTTTSLFAQVVLGTGSLGITAGSDYPPDQAGPYQISGLTVSTGANPGSSFETFCLGTQVDYTPGTLYNYQISDTVEPSGGALGGNVGAPAYVTWGTAYLYSQFRANTLSGDINNTGNDAVNDALQVAIWTLQGQNYSGITLSGTLNTGDVTIFLQAATNAATADHISSGVEADADGAFGVYALDMYAVGSNPPDYVQPQLCIVPVSEASTVYAGALLLLPFGASAFRIIRKKSVTA